MSGIKDIPVLSILFLFCLLLLNGIGATLPIPNLTIINEHYQFPLIGLVEAIFVLISTLLLFLWGYFADKLDRKSILWIANIFWIFPSLMIFLFPDPLLIYILGRIGMAIGLSAFSPLAYSILADFAKFEKRGVISSALNLAWVGSSAAGILIGGFFSPNWYDSFGFIALLGILILFWQFFLQVPLRARQEPAFSQLENYNYHWRIELNEISKAIKSKTIIWLLVQGTFALIPGTIFTYWLVSFLASPEGLGISIGSASLLAIIVASGRALGYPVFGSFGDILSLNSNNSQIRAKIASICMAGQAFFFFFAFLFIDSLFINLILFSGFFWLGSFIGAASGPNRTALLFNVSLPENRGSLGALFSVTDQIGVIIGIIMSTLWLQLSSFRTVFTLSLGFYLVAALAWTLSFPYIQGEQLNIQKIMTSRAKIISQTKF